MMVSRSETSLRATPRTTPKLGPLVRPGAAPPTPEALAQAHPFTKVTARSPRYLLDELLARSDFVTLHAPLNAGTRHLIGRRELSLMPAHAFLIPAKTVLIGDQVLRALAHCLSSGLRRIDVIGRYGGEGKVRRAVQN